MDPHQHLSRRERQLMDLLYAQGELSVNDLQRQLPDPPATAAVRTMLAILTDKSLIKRRKTGRAFLYSARSQRRRAGQSALQRVIRTFFDGSLEKAVSAYLVSQKAPLSTEERDRLRDLIDQSRADAAGENPSDQ